jgi:uncharacterized membrane protein
VIVAAIFGVVLIAGHNLLDGVNAASLGAAEKLWLILHQQGLLISGDRFVLVAYPLIPWIGVTAVGFALGRVWEWDAARRRTFLWWAGSAATIGFLVLRSLNGYGDPRPWSGRPSPLFTMLSWLNVTKYPPSLLFLLMTLGPCLLLLRAIDGGVPRWLRPVMVYGRVPLFYFALHFMLIHFLALLFSWFRYGEIHWVFESPTLDKYPFAQPPGWPFPLPPIYALWVLVVVSLWPLCRWFDGIKSRRRHWWLSYL